MIRILVENILIFLLPTLLYAAYVVATAPASENDAERTLGRVLEEAPYLWLATAGAILVVLSLIAFGNFDGGKPGTKYQPQIMKDGHIVHPGQVK